MRHERWTVLHSSVAICFGGIEYDPSCLTEIMEIHLTVTISYVGLFVAEYVDIPR